MKTDDCWKCGQASEQSLFCRFCNSLQPPTPDYFGFFSLKRSLNLDGADLQQRYYTLSRQVHPDRFQRGIPHEQQFALDATAILNDAYRTLRDPVSRAEYVLKEEGFEPAEKKSKRVPSELLEDVFEANMALEELRGGAASMRPAVEQALKCFRALRTDVDRDMEPLFAEFDRTGTHDTLGKIRGLLDRRSYMSNLIEELEEGLGQ